MSRGSKKIPLTPTEFRLLEVLMRRANRAVSRSTIIEAVWGFNEEIEPEHGGRLTSSSSGRKWIPIPKNG